jgi:hypothetical protein
MQLTAMAPTLLSGPAEEGEPGTHWPSLGLCQGPPELSLGGRLAHHSPQSQPLMDPGPLLITQPPRPQGPALWAKIARPFLWLERPGLWPQHGIGLACRGALVEQPPAWCSKETEWPHLARPALGVL